MVGGGSTAGFAEAGAENELSTTATITTTVDGDLPLVRTVSDLPTRP
jgi:hypothetical protein